MNYSAVVVATLAWFVVGAPWYSPLVFGKAYMEVRGTGAGAMAGMRIRVGEMLGEFARGLVVAYGLARFVVLLGIAGWSAAAALGLWAWVGLWAAILVGSVLPENMPWRLYAIHAGDGLVKLPLIALILGVWR